MALKMTNRYPVFRIRIRPDPILFGLKDLDPDPDLKLLISDPDLALALDPSIFHPNLEICFENALKSEQIHYNFIHNT